MTGKYLILFGPLAALVLVGGITLLPISYNGYDPVFQTVSEIGQIGSPVQKPFAAMLFTEAACLLIFAWGLRDAARRDEVSTIPAWLVGCMAITVFGLACFPFPLDLHNVIGPTELIGYQAPLVLAVTWRRCLKLRSIVVFSGWLAFALWISTFANLSVLFRHTPVLGAIWSFERPIYGLIQRSLFAGWAIWCFGSGYLLRQTKRPD